MSEVTFKINDKGRGGFFIFEEGQQLGEMEIGISGKDLIAYHTEVLPKAEGKGFAKKLFAEMVTYVRAHKMKVIPLCPFVLAQFKRHADEYADIWNKSRESGP
jgi:predicted GNAT family acetyltransferase